MTAIRITEPRSKLAVTALLLPEKAPENAAFLKAYLGTPRVVPGIHAMWTGPEISCPVPSADLEDQAYARPLPAENATLIERLLDGEPGPRRDIVLLNAAAGLLITGRVPSLQTGIERAADSLDSGAARQVLTELRRITTS